MATESLYPTGTAATTNLTGTYLDVDDDPDAPDANWMTATVTSSNTSARYTFQTPTGPPTATANGQSFRVYVRKHAAAGGTPTVTLELYENGTFRSTLASGVDVTSATGQVVAASWTYSGFTFADGRDVEIRVAGTTGGGGPNRRTVEIGAVEWVVDYTAGTPANPTPATIGGVGGVGVPAVSVTFGVLLPDMGVSAVPAPTVAATGDATAPATALGAVSAIPLPAVSSSGNADATVVIGDILDDTLHDYLTNNPHARAAVSSAAVSVSVTAVSVALLGSVSIPTVQTASGTATVDLTGSGGVSVVAAVSVTAVTVELRTIGAVDGVGVVPLPGLATENDETVSAVSVTVPVTVPAATLGVANNETLTLAEGVQGVVSVPAATVDAGQGIDPAPGTVSLVADVGIVSPSTDSDATKTASTVAGSAGFGVFQVETAGNATKAAATVSAPASVPVVRIDSPVGVSPVAVGVAVPRPGVGVRRFVGDINVVSSVPAAGFGGGGGVNADTVTANASVPAGFGLAADPNWTHFYTDKAEVPA